MIKEVLVIEIFLIDFLGVFNISFGIFLSSIFGKLNISSKSVIDSSYSIIAKIFTNTKLSKLSILRI